MSYEAVVAQIRAAPESCLDEISQIISAVVHRYEQETADAQTPSPRLAEAMREALRISDDPAVKGYADTKELFKVLDA